MMIDIGKCEYKDMSVGEQIKKERIKAGFSQRELCGSEITRNMLSQIENGKAQPSLHTLRYIAQRLEVSVGELLAEEKTEDSIISRAWQLYENGNSHDALLLLKDLQIGESERLREYALLVYLCRIAEAKKAVNAHKPLLAKRMLKEAAAMEDCVSWIPEICRIRIYAAGMLETLTPEELPNIDAECYVHAQTLLHAGAVNRAAAFLEAMQDQNSVSWMQLRGRVYMSQGDYESARKLLQNAEDRGDTSVYNLLEICCKELEDFKNAYHYACLARERARSKE